MSGKKKVFIVVSILRDGGAQRAAGNISLALEKDYDVTFVTFSADRAAYPHGGTLRDLRLPRKKGSLASLCNDLRRARALRRLKEELRPDVSISFLQDANFANILSRGVGKTVVSLRTHLSSRSMGRLARFESALAYSRADAVVSVSRAAQEDLLCYGWAPPEKCRVIGNMVDGEALLRRAGRAVGKEEKSRGPVIASMGSLTDQKGMWNLIRAFKAILPMFSDARLVIYGGGHREQYDELCAGLGISDRVTLAGFVVDPHARLAGADLFVFPSRYEGMPNALLEAMALALPVISTDCLSGPREILAPDTDLTRQATKIEYAPWGVITPVPKGPFLNASAPLTAEELLLSEAMRAMLSDRELLARYAALARERAAMFSPQAIGDKWKQLIEDITE